MTVRVVIVGGGCFGISTALHLLRRSYVDVTVLDRAPELPALDAASTDLNKIVRSSYHDSFYTGLAREAIKCWKDREEWGDVYHESGVLVLGAGKSLYADEAVVNDIAHGARVRRLRIPQEKGEAADTYTGSGPNKDDSITLPELFPPDIQLGEKFADARGFFNADGGWAAAEDGVRRAIEKVRKLGGKVLAGKDVEALLKAEDTGATCGVRCKDGSEYGADMTVLATGSWTASAFPELKLQEKCLSTGQSVATIQLTSEEAERYRSCPVFLDFGPSGFYCFPPNKQNIFKFAKHAGGYTNFLPTSEAADAPKISVPRTILSHGTDGLRIPRSEAKLIRDSLREVYPELAMKPIASTRLCWYTDAPGSDWIIDIHPDDPGLMLATAGSGHAYKFLPIIGRLVADRLEGKMEPELQKKFAVNRSMKKHDPYRDGRLIRELDVANLCGPEDLTEQ